VKGLASQANVLARIGALGGFYDVELDSLDELLGTLGPELAHGATVTVPVTFDRIAVTARIARDRLDGVVDREQLRRLGKLAPDAREVEIEVETAAPELTRTVFVPGSRDVASDCEQLTRFGVGTLALDSVRDCAAHLGIPFALSDRARRGTQEWLLHFALRNRSDAERATTRAQVLTVARKLAATAPQCNLIDGLHDMLAKDRDSYATLVISPELTSPRLVVRWQYVRWKTVIRMALGFRPKSDAGKKLGELSGAFDAEEAAAIELVLGPAEPPVMSVAVAFAT
jgi:hypothetical protein